MSCIYKITNKLTGMSYVGNTSYDIKKRWGEHCRDAKKERCKDRPLYAAMNKYGFDNFEVTILEECSPDEANSKEVSWINKLNTYKSGYNDTYGGAGKHKIDYRIVVQSYLKTKNKHETATELEISPDSVKDILRSCNVESYSQRDAMMCRAKQVNVYSTGGEFINGFKSISYAADWVCTQKVGLKQTNVCKTIQNACKNRLKSAYGYVWKYADAV